MKIFAYIAFVLPLVPLHAGSPAPATPTDTLKLIEEANAANIRAAKAEGEVLRLRKRVAELEAQVAADPFAPAPAGESSAATPAKLKTWQTVQTLQGSGNKRGPKFTIWGEWRAQWQFTAEEVGLFIAQIEGDDAADAQILANTTKSGRDVTMGKGVGELVLDVTALQGSWAVKIEELR